MHWFGSVESIGMIRLPRHSQNHSSVFLCPIGRSLDACLAEPRWVTGASSGEFLEEVHKHSTDGKVWLTVLIFRMLVLGTAAELILGR